MKKIGNAYLLARQGITGLSDSQPIVAYDLSLPLPERLEKATLYPSIKKVAEAMGRSHGYASKCTYTGTRLKDINGKEWAVRIASKELIEKLSK